MKNAVEIVTIIIAGLYLITFALSIFSCQKMLGIELMYLIQLTFYYMVPINFICNPFRRLEMLKYASGLISFYW